MSLLAIIGEEGEDISDLLNASTSKESDQKKKIKQVKTSKQLKKNLTSEKLQMMIDIPEGVTVVTMPRLSDTMEEGTVATWLKKVGDKVRKVISWQKLKLIKRLWNLNRFNLELFIYWY